MRVEGRVLGVDHGDVRFGFAISDVTRTIARPFDVVEGKEPVILDWIEATVQEEEVVEIVLGLPMNMDGSLGKKAKQILEFRDRLAKRVEVPIETWDERLTTVQAQYDLEEQGITGRKQKGKIDAAAAQVILRSYLDRPRPE
ncbi:MAG: Holliday junction resolvase RuvX [Planctomycetota bacterium]